MLYSNSVFLKCSTLLVTYATFFPTISILGQVAVGVSSHARSYINKSIETFIGKMKKSLICRKNVRPKQHKPRRVRKDDCIRLSGSRKTTSIYTNKSLEFQ